MLRLGKIDKFIIVWWVNLMNLKILICKEIYRSVYVCIGDIDEWKLFFCVRFINMFVVYKVYVYV